MKRLVLVCGILVVVGGFVMAEEADSIMDAIVSGTPLVNARLRYEHAESDGAKDSDAFTLRTRLGYSTLKFKGLRGFVEYEDVTSLGDEDDYNSAGLNTNALDHTVIADPEALELNQAYLEYMGCDSVIVAGRQRIIIDNARFIGNVGWRQNEQTYDAYSVKNESIKDVSLYYAFVDKVYRIFGQEHGVEPDGSAGNAARYQSESHLINVGWGPCDSFSGSLYGYLLDFGEGMVGAANSSDTYGLSCLVKHKGEGDCSASLALEYASQSDNSATTVGMDYTAGYFMADLSAGAPVARFGVGYELLGSDNGVGFKTPLATAHKFNGWADVFLVTPAEGLEDMYVYLSTECPKTGAKMKVVYHDFSSDTGGIDYGDEFDVVLSRKAGENVTIIAKYSNYNADSGPMNPLTSDVERVSVEASLAF